MYRPKLHKITKYSVGKSIININKDSITIFKEPYHTNTLIKNNRWDKRFLVENDYYDIKKLLLVDKDLLLKNKEFKKYFKNYSINMDKIEALPWYYKNKQQKSWLNNEYIGLKFYLKNSLLMNQFVNL